MRAPRATGSSFRYTIDNELHEDQKFSLARGNLNQGIFEFDFDFFLKKKFSFFPPFLAGQTSQLTSGKNSSGPHERDRREGENNI